MADERRVLKINPDLFSLTNNTTRKKTRSEPIKMKQDKRKREDTIRNKAKILRMIRERQADQYKNLFDNKKPLPPNNEINAFNNNFDEATEFLANLEKKHQHKPAHNSTLRVHDPQPSRMNYISDFMSSTEPPPPPMFSRPSVPSIPPQPKYGILKNGVLPTQRTYMRNMTQKNYPQQHHPHQPPPQHPHQHPPPPQYPHQYQPPHQYPPIHTNGIEQFPQIDFNNVAPDQIITNKIKNSIEQIKQDYANQTITKERDKQFNVPKIYKQRKIKRRTYKIGKTKGSRKIAVLISNKTIRRNINEKAQKVKQVPMSDVKKHLVNRGFIKNCTSATNDVLRKMYESTILMCGEVYNHNSDNLLYNFFNEDK